MTTTNTLSKTTAYQILVGDETAYGLVTEVDWDRDRNIVTIQFDSVDTYEFGPREQIGYFG